MVGPEGLPNLNDFNLLCALGANFRCEENQGLKNFAVPLFWTKLSAFPALVGRVV